MCSIGEGSVCEVLHVHDTECCGCWCVQCSVVLTSSACGDIPGSHNIFDGDRKLILGLVWTLIQKYQLRILGEYY